MEHSFSIREALREGWRLLRAHSLLVFEVMLTLFAIEVASAVVSRVLGGTLLGVLASIALGVLMVFVGAGFMRIALKLARGELAHYTELLPPVGVVLNYFLASLLAGVVTLLPIVAAVALAFAGSVVFAHSAIVHGVFLALVVAFGAIGAAYFALRYFFVKWAAVDGVGVTDSLRRSAALTAGEKWHLVLFILTLLGLNLLGFVALVVGLVVTIPMTILATSWAFVTLSAR